MLDALGFAALTAGVVLVIAMALDQIFKDWF